MGQNAPSLLSLKEKRLIGILGIEALWGGAYFRYQACQATRRLSLFFLVSLSPIVALLLIRKRRKLCVEDGLLALLSAVLFAVLYIMINLGVISTWTGRVAAQPIGKAMLGGMAYSVLCGYFVLRVLRLFSNGGTEKLAHYMSVMLRLLAVLFVYVIFGVCFNGLLDSVTALRAGNVGNEHLLGTTYAFLVLQLIIDALPYAFNVLILFTALHLLDEMRVDRYSAETVRAAAQISRLCTTALVVMILTNVSFNLLQFLFVKSLVVTNGSVRIPIFSITFVLAALLLTRLTAESKQLKDDNDMFI